MDSSNIICPVCTLYLRTGITLKNHLASHPKHKVIEALVRLADPEGIQKNALSSPPSSSSTVITTTPTTPVTQHQQQLPSHHQQNTTCSPGGNANSQINIVNQTWNQGNIMNMAPNVQQMQGNHLFIYQQSMSSTTGPQQNVLNVNQLSPQYVIPTVLNPQMMPYVYQQQQVIMSSGSCLAPPLRSLPYEIQAVAASPSPTTEQISDTNIIEIDKDPSKDQHSSNEDLTVDCNGDKHQQTITIKDDTDLQKVNTFIDLKFYDDDNNNNDDGENHEHEQNYETTNPSPHSPTGSDWSIRVRSDLSKACQTQNNNLSPRSVIQNDNIDIVEINTTKPDEPEFYFVDACNHQPQQQQQQENDENDDDNDNNSNTVIISQQDYKQSNPIYTASNILQSNDHIDFVDMDGVQMVMNDFSTNQIISQVENFEGSRPDRPGVLMTIGGMVDDNHDESLSRESSNVNIRADERMPPRGELSGQESIDGTTNDTTWNRIQYDNGNPSYDNMFARDNWAGSDNSNIDVPPPYEDQENDDNDMPTIVSFSGPPLNFKCSTCGDAFQSTKERKQHEIEKHGDKTKLNHIGTEIGKKKVKKLIVRLKETKSENDNNFDNVFTNKLKLENPIIGNENGEIQTNNQNENLPTKIDDAVTVDVKTICSLCEAVLPNVRALRDHKLQIHNISSQTRHKCTTCNQVFQNDYKFSEHLRIHPLECKLCGKLFYRRQNIQLHMRRHLGIKPYKCDVCEKSFLTKQKLQEHRNIHTGETPIKCNLCNETFRRYSNLVQHRNRHHLNVKKKVKDYICFCKEIFHSKTKLAWHKEIHDPKPKSCTQCSEKFIHMSSLTRHMRRAHNSHFLPNGHKSSENVECPICKGIYLKSSLEVHIKNHSGQRPFKCLICNKSFTTRWNLKLHKWTHASRVSKPFKCDQCKGAFIRESDYVAHMNSHKSIRPYTCNYCGAKFIRKSNCQRHVREHENDKTFRCKVCDKTFHRSYYLKDHMRIHTGVRPYSCHICGKTSTTKSNHNKHVQIHHAREPVSTEN